MTRDALVALMVLLKLARGTKPSTGPLKIFEKILPYKVGAIKTRSFFFFLLCCNNYRDLRKRLSVQDRKDFTIILLIEINLIPSCFISKMLVDPCKRSEIWINNLWNNFWSANNLNDKRKQSRWSVSFRRNACVIDQSIDDSVQKYYPCEKKRAAQIRDRVILSCTDFARIVASTSLSWLSYRPIVFPFVFAVNASHFLFLRCSCGQNEIRLHLRLHEIP